MGVNILPNTTLTVRSTPAGDRIGTQPNGAEGTKVGEPQEANGRMWQQVDFDNSNIDGWVAASLIVQISLPTPTPTPSTPPGDCPDGELADWASNPGARYKEAVRIAVDAPKTFCVTYNGGNNQYADVDVWDRGECLTLKLRVTTPNGLTFEDRAGGSVAALVSLRPGRFLVRIETTADCGGAGNVQVSFVPR